MPFFVVLAYTVNGVARMKNDKPTPTGRSCVMPMERPKRLFLVRKYSPGDRVHYHGDETDRGTVTEVSGRRV